MHRRCFITRGLSLTGASFCCATVLAEPLPDATPRAARGLGQTAGEPTASQGSTGQTELPIEVIELHHARAESLLPVLEPLVPAPGVLRAHENRIIVRSTAENLAQIRRLIQSLDQAPVDFVIHVRRGRGLNARPPSTATGNEAIVVRGRDGAVTGTRSWRTHEDDRLQRVRVQAGEEAFIATGESRVLYEQHTPRHRRASDIEARREHFDEGFFVRARPSGELVTLEIRPRAHVRDRDDQSGRLYQAASTLRVRPGEWVELASSRTGNTTGKGTWRAGAGYADRLDVTIWIMVERVP